MSDYLAYLSWLLASIGVPILAPVALLPLLNLSLAYRDVAADALKAAVRHGQLFWTVIAMCASACYELGCAMDRTSSAIGRSLIWIGLLWHTGFIVVSTVIVVFGSADAQTLSKTAKARANERSVISLSLLFTAAISVSYAASHYFTLEYLSTSRYN